jgi:hypothetical protein
MVALLLFFMFLFSYLYLFFLPVPWTEYSLKGNTNFKNKTDSYKLGVGVFGGTAWGIVPPRCAEKEDVGKSLKAGWEGPDGKKGWEKEDGLYKLSFRLLKKGKTKDNKESKRRDMMIFQAAPKDSYNYWEDYLRYDVDREALILVKRVHDGVVRIPGRRDSNTITLHDEEEIKKSMGKIKRAEIAFFREDEGGVSWPLLIGLHPSSSVQYWMFQLVHFSWLAFLFAYSIYWREEKALKAEQVKSVE